MCHLEFNQVIQWKFLFSLIMYLVTWTKKSTEKSIHFYHISSNFLQCYNLYSWQMSISAVLFTESYWKNWYCKFFFLQVVIHVQDGCLIRMPTRCRQAEVCPLHLIDYMLINPLQTPQRKIRMRYRYSRRMS